MISYRILPPEGILEAEVKELPLSKSVAARALILSAMTPGAALPGKDTLPQCDDIDALYAALRSDSPEISVHESGTALRFLTAYFACKEGTDVTLTGSERLCQRPVAPLVDALISLGADIKYAQAPGCAPLKIHGKNIEGGTVRINAAKSSQFASALLMAAAQMPKGLVIDFGGEFPSKPYVKMTLEMLRARGINAEQEGYKIIVEPGELRPVDPESEADWTAAAYWYEAVTLSSGFVNISGLSADSLQGDRFLAQLGERLGVSTEFNSEGVELAASPECFSRLDMDLSDHPDLFPSLAVTCALTGTPFRFEGVGNLRHKESDRLEAVRKGLEQFGIMAYEEENAFGWEGDSHPVGDFPRIDGCGDHRIVMAFAMAALVVPGIIVDGCEAVAKSYPGFWDDLRSAGFTLLQPDEPFCMDLNE